MEKDISFETAQSVKAKGFNEICEKHYDKNGVLFTSYGEPFKPNDKQPHEELFTAPTQSFLRNWFRKVHKIHISIDPMLDVWVIEIKELNGIHGNPCFIGYPDLEYEIYEEALETALLQASFFITT